ncbi:MAG: riboflavin biosynthesis protein RibF [Candidatus Caenarcaniphilales bacterium]|nr:riboflavin biosynthesis protein RibF [Candidatus Caenarcaniphilales bacterium]
MPTPFEIIRLSKDQSNTRPRAIALGTFDGVHLGHQALLNSVREAAKLKDLNTSCTTFAKPPIIWTDPDREVQSLDTLEERLTLLARYGMQEVIVINFPAIASLSPEEYLNQILRDQLRCVYICTGFNHRFGQGQAGDINLLKSWGAQHQIEVQEIAPVLDRCGQRISSSQIRQNLSEGDLASANQLMGHRFLFSAEIVPGRKLGRQIGFPTINCLYPIAKLIPKLGVYAAYAQIGDASYPAAVNIGYAPTASCDRIVRFETHLLGEVSEDLLAQIGSHLTVELVEYIRPEMKFESLDALKNQIGLDCQRIAVKLEETPGGSSQVLFSSLDN